MAKIKDGSTYLGNHLTANDYYSEGESVTGKWQGELAKEWGLENTSIQSGDKIFEGLRTGTAPDGTKLAQRASEVKFYDFQCSAQKSVSVMSMLDDRLHAAHDRAAATAFKELESFAARRLRSGDDAWTKKTASTGKVCAAIFRHDASRALDPQLHTHHVVANVTADESGKRYALESVEMVKAIRYAGKVYQNELAKECRSLGYEVSPSRDEKGRVTGFELLGVSPEICQRFSKRRVDVEKGIEDFRAKYGRAPSVAEIHDITTKTRGFKPLDEISTPQVRANQIGQLTNSERTALEALAHQARHRRDHVSPPPREAVQMALQSSQEHLFERQSTAHGHEIMAQALNHRLGAIDLGELKQSLQTEKEIVLLNGTTSLQSSEFTSRDNLAREKASVKFVDQGINQSDPLCKKVETAAWLADEQKKAVSFLCSTKDRVSAIRGIAGTGKTTMLKEADKNLTKAGHHLLYLAPTAAAVKVLRSEGFTNATTVADYLTRHHAGKEESSWRKAVIVIDEAGLQSTRQGSDVLRLAEVHDNRVVFVGDSKQHSSVEAGDFLRILETHSKIKTVELKEIRRQTVQEYNQAIRAMSSGEAAAGLQRLDDLGWVHEKQGDYLLEAARRYVEHLEAGKEAVAVAPTHAEGRAMTGGIRAKLQEKGLLDNVGENREVIQSNQWTTAEKKQSDRYQLGQMITATGKCGEMKKGESAKIERIEKDRLHLAGGKTVSLQDASKFDVGQARTIPLARGDKILITANDKKNQLTNGQVLTVERVFNGAIMTKEGPAISKDFQHLNHGYVVTSHKSQGRTAEAVVVAAEKLDSKACYVATSRGRERCDVFTPDKANLYNSLPRSGERRSALDALSQQQKTQESPSIVNRAKAWGRDVGQKVSQGLSRVKESWEKARNQIFRHEQPQTLRQQSEKLPKQSEPISPTPATRQNSKESPSTRETLARKIIQENARHQQSPKERGGISL